MQWNAGVVVLGLVLHSAPFARAQPGFVVLDGPCTVSGNCVRSPNYPNNYGPDQTCAISTWMNPTYWLSRSINVNHFNTEGCCDKLYIDGIAYSGTANSPQCVNPTGEIYWSSDAVVVRDGWEICGKGGDFCEGGGSIGEVVEDITTSDSSGDSSSGSSSSTTIVILIVVFGGLVLIGGAVCCVLRRRSRAPAPSTSSVGASVAVPPPRPPSIIGGSVAPAPVDVEGNEEARPFAKHRKPFAEIPSQLAACPTHWQHTALAGRPFNELVGVDAYTEEIIQKAVDATFKSVKTRDRTGGAVPKRLKVVNVLRNENSEVWKKYAVDRFAMKAKRNHRCTLIEKRGGIAVAKELAGLQGELLREINETYLWHGTSPSGADGIRSGGFDLKFCGTGAGSMYGKGLYFAECSSKSDEYAKDETSGVYKDQFSLLLCRVVLGEQLILTAGGEAVHTMISESIKSEAYDSIMGDREASVGTYREFVIYEDSLAYPEYLVFYKRVM